MCVKYRCYPVRFNFIALRVGKFSCGLNLRMLFFVVLKIQGKCVMDRKIGSFPKNARKAQSCWFIWLFKFSFALNQKVLTSKIKKSQNSMKIIFFVPSSAVIKVRWKSNKSSHSRRISFMNKIIQYHKFPLFPPKK